MIPDPEDAAVPTAPAVAPSTHTTAAESVSAAVDHLFRQEAGRLVAALTRVFGIDRLELAEDVMQEALLRALRLWPYHGIPANPGGWILSVARNLALDIVRRETALREKTEILARDTSEPVCGAEALPAILDDGLEDDQLRMMFACCHPCLPRDTQVALTLKTLCGFGVPEIAAAFLGSEAAMARKLVRARQRLREESVRFEVPEGPELESRTEAVLDALYLLFNEGYKASQGDALVRRDLCGEAVRLTALLARHPAGNQPQTHALLALMLFNAARLDARTGDDGRLLLLCDQDRSRWDGVLIALGVQHLARSGTGASVTQFHYEAGIAACHCTAPSHATTNWERILGLYDGLLALKPSPVVALNRAVALARVRGPRAGLQALHPLESEPALARYHLLPAVKAHLLEEIGDPEQALQNYRRALEWAVVPSERDFLSARCARLE